MDNGKSVNFSIVISINGTEVKTGSIKSVYGIKDHFPCSDVVAVHIICPIVRITMRQSDPLANRRLYGQEVV